MEAKETIDLYDFEISRFQELLQNDQKYAFQRYGCSVLYSLPPEETFQIKKELGWKSQDGVDFYNEGTIECQKGNFKDALKHFEKAMSLGCEIPELFFNVAAVYEEQGDKKKAKEHYQKYIDTVEKWDDIPKGLQAELDEAREHIKEL